MQHRSLGYLLALSPWLAASPAVAEQGSDETYATVVEFRTGDTITLQRFDHEQAGIEIDGRLVEAAWTEVPGFHGLKVVEPDTLNETPYETVVRLFYTDSGIYVGFDLMQPSSTIVRRFTPRDAFEINRDNVSFTLDTSGSGRFGYWMNLSLGDSQMDGTLLPEREWSREWDGAWHGATAEHDDGWTAEFFIPWSQMAMPKEASTRRIGLYVSRKVAHLNERWAWPPLPESQPRFISAFHSMELEGIDPRRQWSVFPYASSTIDRAVDEVRYKAGLDFWWRPLSNLQLTGTLNPDFGSVESDDVVVNLTADEVFFPEKRLFFQEGQEIFETTPRTNAEFGRKLTIVNTRRIGGRPREIVLPPGSELSPRQELQPADLLAAGKATGQFGRFRFGLLAASEDETSYIVDGGEFIQDGRDFGTVRVLYEDSKGAAYRGLGLISTAVLHPESDAFVNGLDFHYLSTSGRWKIDGQLMHSDSDENGSGVGFIGDIRYTVRQGLTHTIELTAFDDKIDVSDLGFQRRNDISEILYSVDWIRSGLTSVRDFKLTPFARLEVNGDGLRTENPIGVEFEVNLNNLDVAEGFVGYSPARYDDRNSFGNGTFRVAAQPFAELKYTTDTSRAVSVGGKLEYRGEDVEGGQWTAGGGVTWQARHNLVIELRAEFNKRDGWLLHQEGQNFTSFRSEQWRPELSLEIFPTAMQQFRVALQWAGIRAEEDRFYTLPDGSNDLVEGPKPPGPPDDFSLSQLNFQVRYRWQIAPLSDLFVVYTKVDNRTTDLTDFNRLFQDSWRNPLGDQLVVKLRYRLGS